MTLELMDNKVKRRDKLVIMMDIIGIAKKGVSKTHIMFRANLSFSQLNEYLEFLLNHDLIEVASEDGRMVYKPTEKGLEFMEMQQQVLGMLSEKGKSYVKFNCNFAPKSKPFAYSA
jgi:predicted transcriptional regulator